MKKPTDQMELDFEQEIITYRGQTDSFEAFLADDDDDPVRRRLRQLVAEKVSKKVSN